MQEMATETSPGVIDTGDSGFEVHRSTGATRGAGCGGARADVDVRNLNCCPVCRRYTGSVRPTNWRGGRSGRKDSGSAGNGVEIAAKVIVMAGPCSVESREQIVLVATGG